MLGAGVGAPNDAAKEKATRLQYFMYFMLLFALVKYFISPTSASIDLMLSFILYCGIYSMNYTLFVLYELLFLVNAVNTLAAFLTLIQYGRPIISDTSAVNMLRLMILLSVFIQAIGMLWNLQ